MIIYVESKTSLLWEVQLFEDFAMIRLATPGYEASLKRITLEEFGRDFEEFWGDPDQVFAYLRGEVMTTQIN